MARKATRRRDGRRAASRPASVTGSRGRDGECASSCARIASSCSGPIPARRSRRHEHDRAQPPDDRRHFDHRGLEKPDRPRDVQAFRQPDDPLLPAVPVRCRGAGALDPEPAGPQPQRQKGHAGKPGQEDDADRTSGRLRGWGGQAPAGFRRSGRRSIAQLAPSPVAWCLRLAEVASFETDCVMTVGAPSVIARHV